MKTILNIPVHYERPTNPDDEPWIESLNKNLKYHRNVPGAFETVSDVTNLFSQLNEIYNNKHLSSLKYVTPAEALAGKTKVILQTRKRNLTVANLMRLDNHRNAGLQVEIR